MPTTSSVLSRILEHHQVPDAQVAPTDDAASFESVERAARALRLQTRAGRMRSYDALVRLDVLPAVVDIRKRVTDRTFALRDDGELDDVGRAWSLELVHHADATGVELEHPETGRYRMSRAEFEAAWRGAILCFAGAPRRRWTLRRIWRGCTQVPASAVVAIAALCVLVAGACVGPAVLVPAIAGALAASVWATVTARGCAACHAARSMIGWSLGPLGVAGYAMLLAALLVVGPALPLVATLFGAAGVHVALVGRLATWRLRCTPCLAAAVAAWLGAGAALAIAPAALIVAPLAGLAAHRALTHVTERARTSLRDAVRGILSERRVVSGVTMVVYKLDGCPACQHVQDVVLPPLAEQMGDRLRIELRPMHPQLPAPTIAVFGARRSVALLGIPDPHELEEALAV